MTQVERLAEFAARASFDDMSREAREQTKIRVLDSLGCALGASGADLLWKLRAHTDDLDGGRCTLIGGGTAAPDRASFFNGAMVRYLDFNDSYLAPGETCHPSDNVAAVLAAAEHAGRRGREFLAALAVAYQVQCRLSDVAPVRAKGFDHTTQGAFAAAAGAARALGLDREAIANAVAIAGTSLCALRVTRTGALSNWKGLAYPAAAMGAVHAALLASRGVTGPLEVFEGAKGFMQSISGPFEIDWGREDLERVTRTVIKKHNAEVHSQSAIDAMIELRRDEGARLQEIERVDVEVFDVAYNIIGGGNEGSKMEVKTKEEADHSLPYVLAAAFVDGEVTPAQYRDGRIGSHAIQGLMKKIHVRPDEALSRRFPAEMPCRITMTFAEGRKRTVETKDFDGFTTHPLKWGGAVAKFERLAAKSAEPAVLREIVDVVGGLESAKTADLTKLLAMSGKPHRRS